MQSESMPGQDDRSTRFEMTEVFSGLMLSLIAGEAARVRPDLRAVCGRPENHSGA
jgi:hypothetical protein